MNHYQADRLFRRKCLSEGKYLVTETWLMLTLDAGHLLPSEKYAVFSPDPMPLAKRRPGELAPARLCIAGMHRFGILLPYGPCHKQSKEISVIHCTRERTGAVPLMMHRAPEPTRMKEVVNLLVCMSPKHAEVEWLSASKKSAETSATIQAAVSFDWLDQCLRQWRALDYQPYIIKEYAPCSFVEN